MHEPDLSAQIVISHRLTISVKEFCRLSGIGKTKTNSLIREGKLTVIRLGRRTLITYESALALIAPAQHKIYVEALMATLYNPAPAQNGKAR